MFLLSSLDYLQNDEKLLSNSDEIQWLSESVFLYAVSLGSKMTVEGRA